MASQLAVRHERPADLARHDPDLFTPRTMAEMMEFGKAIVASQVYPSMKRPEHVLAAIQIARDTGARPSAIMANIAFINGRACLYGDGLLAAAYESGNMVDFAETFEGTGEGLTAVCRVVRRGIETPVVRRFSVADAKTAGLWSKPGPWKTYPRRMLQMRARAWALRDAGLTTGVSSAEEMRDVGEVADDAPRMNLAAPAQAEKANIIDPLLIEPGVTVSESVPQEPGTPAPDAEPPPATVAEPTLAADAHSRELANDFTERLAGATGDAQLAGIGTLIAKAKDAGELLAEDIEQLQATYRDRKDVLAGR